MKLLTKPPNVLLSIDPGITGTGVAIFRQGKLWFTNTLVPSFLDQDYVFRAIDVAHMVAGEVPLDLGAFDTIMEIPTVYQSNAGRGAQRSGSIIKLAFLAGMVHGLVLKKMEERQRHHAEIRCVTAPEWKGQLPHKIVVKRVVRAYPEMAEKGITEHEIDAVGLGIFYLKGAFR